VSSDTAEARTAVLAPPGTRHGPLAQLLIALSPLSAIPLLYWLAQWITAPLGLGEGSDTNRLGFRLDTTGPAAADRSVFGTVPTVWLQERLLDGVPHWYDGVAALVYASHFAAIPVVTGVVWFCQRPRFRGWVFALGSFTVLGVTGYVVHPAAPPWLASGTERVSTLGWDHLGLDRIGDLLTRSQEASNPVAAMPSLHAGAALLVALFLWPVVTAAWRAVLLGYALLMALTLVYTGEHYVVDAVAGWLVAVTAVTVGAVADRVRLPARR
jgi:membrane-associated phospholipid phosphatase